MTYAPHPRQPPDAVLHDHRGITHTLRQRLDETDDAFSGRCDAAWWNLDLAARLEGDERREHYPDRERWILGDLARARRAVLGGSPNL